MIRRPSAHTVEDAEHLLSFGVAPLEVCTRLGRTPHAVAMACYRAGRPELAPTFERLRTRRPRPSATRRYRIERQVAA